MPAVTNARVTVIPAKKDIPVNVLSGEERKRLRVAAYARVSTNNEEQLTSYEAQVDYYTRYIQSKEEWEFVAVYTDEGISATNTKKRDGFNRMVADALAQPKARRLSSSAFWILKRPLMVPPSGCRFSTASGWMSENLNMPVVPPS